MTQTSIIYADNAATTQLDSDARKYMLPFLDEYYGNASSLYGFTRNCRIAIRAARKIIADCIGAQIDEIYFTSGGTESDNWAIKAFDPMAPFEQLNDNTWESIQVLSSDESECVSAASNGRVLVSAIEHKAVLNSCRSLKRKGASISVLPVDRCGMVASDTLAEAIRIQPARAQVGKSQAQSGLVSVMLANNEIGTIQDIKSLAALAHKAGMLFHTDAVQALGHIPVSVRELDVDLLSGSAHKFNGPKGVGFLYIKKGTNIGPFMDGGAQEHGLRGGTENVAGVIGMAMALNKNVHGMDANRLRLTEATELLRNTLIQGIPEIVFNGDSRCCLPGSTSLSIPGISGESWVHLLDLKGICVSTGAACNSRSTEISHVLRAIGLSDELASGTLRITLSKDNTMDEAQQIADTMVSLYKLQRSSVTEK